MFLCRGGSNIDSFVAVVTSSEKIVAPLIGSCPTSPVRYAKFESIRYFIDIDILQNCLIDIDIDIFQNDHIDININIFKNDHIDIDIDIDIFQKCRYIDNRYIEQG